MKTDTGYKEEAFIRPKGPDNFWLTHEGKEIPCGVHAEAAFDYVKNNKAFQAFLANKEEETPNDLPIPELVAYWYVICNLGWIRLVINHDGYNGVAFLKDGISKRAAGLFTRRKFPEAKGFYVEPHDKPFKWMASEPKEFEIHKRSALNAFILSNVGNTKASTEVDFDGLPQDFWISNTGTIVPCDNQPAQTHARTAFEFFKKDASYIAYAQSIHEPYNEVTTAFDYALCVMGWIRVSRDSRNLFANIQIGKWAMSAKAFSKFTSLKLQPEEGFSLDVSYATGSSNSDAFYSFMLDKKRDLYTRMRINIANKATASIYVDNPGGNWLTHKQEDAILRAKGRKGYVSKMLTGAITAFTEKPVKLPLSLFKHIKGAEDEDRKDGDPQFDALLSSVKHGWDYEDNKKYPVLIGVNHLGVAYLLEGNTRVAVANKIGLKDIYAEIRWFNGGEAHDGMFNPGKMTPYLQKSNITEAAAGDEDLANPRFYGYWIGPKGEFETVDHEMHYLLADHVVSRRGFPYGSIPIKFSVIFMAACLGYVKVTKVINKAFKVNRVFLMIGENGISSDCYRRLEQLFKVNGFNEFIIDVMPDIMSQVGQKLKEKDFWGTAHKADNHLETEDSNKALQFLAKHRVRNPSELQKEFWFGKDSLKARFETPEVDPEDYELLRQLRPESNITEAGVNGLLYHYTQPEAAVNILQSKKLKARPSVSTRSDNTSGLPAHFFISFSREKAGSFARRNAYNWGVIFEFDGQEIERLGKLRPIDFWGQRGATRVNPHDLGNGEAEERLLIKKPAIDLTSKNLKSVHLLAKGTLIVDLKDKPEQRDIGIAKTCLRVVSAAKKLGVPVYIYDNNINFFQQAKQRAVPVQKLLDRYEELKKAVPKDRIFPPYVRHESRKNLTAKQFGAVIQMFMSDDYAKLPKDARKLLSNWRRGWREESARSLQASMHNMNSRPNDIERKMLERITLLMGKHKMSGVGQMIDFLVNKWEPIADAWNEKDNIRWNKHFEAKKARIAKESVEAAASYEGWWITSLGDTIKYNGTQDGLDKVNEYISKHEAIKKDWDKFSQKYYDQKAFLLSMQGWIGGVTFNDGELNISIGYANVSHKAIEAFRKRSNEFKNKSFRIAAYEMRNGMANIADTEKFDAETKSEVLKTLKYHAQNKKRVLANYHDSYYKAGLIDSEGKNTTVEHEHNSTAMDEFEKRNIERDAAYLSALDQAIYKFGWVRWRIIKNKDNTLAMNVEFKREGISLKAFAALKKIVEADPINKFAIGVASPNKVGDRIDTSGELYKAFDNERQFLAMVRANVSRHVESAKPRSNKSVAASDNNGKLWFRHDGNVVNILAIDLHNNHAREYITSKPEMFEACRKSQKSFIRFAMEDLGWIRGSFTEGRELAIELSEYNVARKAYDALVTYLKPAVFDDMYIEPLHSQTQKFKANQKTAFASVVRKYLKKNEDTASSILPNNYGWMIEADGKVHECARGYEHADASYEIIKRENWQKEKAVASLIAPDFLVYCKGAMRIAITSHERGGAKKVFWDIQVGKEILGPKTIVSLRKLLKENHCDEYHVDATLYSPAKDDFPARLTGHEFKEFDPSRQEAMINYLRTLARKGSTTTAAVNKPANWIIERIRAPYMLVLQVKTRRTVFQKPQGWHLSQRFQHGELHRRLYIYKFVGVMNAKELDIETRQVIRRIAKMNHLTIPDGFNRLGIVTPEQFKVKDTIIRPFAIDWDTGKALKRRNYITTTFGDFDVSKDLMSFWGITRFSKKLDVAPSYTVNYKGAKTTIDTALAPKTFEEFYRMAARKVVSLINNKYGTILKGYASKDEADSAITRFTDIIQADPAVSAAKYQCEKLFVSDRAFRNKLIRRNHLALKTYLFKLVMKRLKGEPQIYKSVTRGSGVKKKV